MISVNEIPKQSFAATKDLDCSLAKRVIFLVGKSLQWDHDNTVSCVNSQRIEVLHAQYGDAIVVGVSHNLYSTSFQEPRHCIFETFLRCKILLPVMINLQRVAFL